MSSSDSNPIDRSSAWAAAGFTSRGCLEPATVESLSEFVRESNDARRPLLVMGGGTRMGIANRTSASEGIEAGISMLGLAGVDIFEPDEGVLHVKAGTKVADVCAAAIKEGWELPLDSPGANSTVGGVIASAATGPRAHVFGRVADAILGLEVVTPEGEITKCGGRVVKNVTGYDLAKLYCGSFGSLGIVTGAWLRLRPVPARVVTLRAPLSSVKNDFEIGREQAELPGARACVWTESPRTGSPVDSEDGLCFELGGSEALVERDCARLRDSIGAEVVEASSWDGVDRLRDARAAHGPNETVVRARVRGTDAAAMKERLLKAGFSVSCDLGLGVFHARRDGGSKAELVDLRAAAESLGGLMIFESLPDAERSGLDVFGDSGDAGAFMFMARLKARFDPNAILNPGRFQGGL